MKQEQAQLDWGFALLWLVVVAVGIIVSGMLAFLFVWSVGEAVENALGATAGILITGALFGAIFALGAGLGSGFLLQKRGISAGRWIIATVVAGAVGMAIGFTVAFTLFDTDTMPEILAGVMMGLFLGLPIGLGQSLVLRQHQLAVNQWSLINTIAYLLALGLALPLSGEGREWLVLGIMGLSVGAITAFGMVRLLARQTAVAA